MPHRTFRRDGYFLAVAGTFVLGSCAEPPPPPDVGLEASWDSTVVAALDRSELSPVRRQRLAAYAALASYESHASDERSGLLSLAGQLNGLWSVPRVSGAVDAAIVAATAQRALLDSMVPGIDARIDSLATSIAADRRALGVTAAIAERSELHGQAIAARLLEWIGSEQATLVLRHARECTATPPRGRAPAPAPVALAGEAAPPAPATAADAAERRLIAAMTVAEAAASITPTADCVGERVRARLRTRPPAS